MLSGIDGIIFCKNESKDSSFSKAVDQMVTKEMDDLLIFLGGQIGYDTPI